MSMMADSIVNEGTDGQQNGVKLIREGSCEIKIPAGNAVFYNPVQEFNRDLSVSVVQVASEEYLRLHSDSSGKGKFRILEALSASGLRSIRYAKEVKNVTEVIANDISSSAIQNIERNIEHNNVENIVKSSHLDAVEVMFKNRHKNDRFQIVDLDPYGSPSQFLDSAVQCVSDGGLLFVTCTDTAVLCGVTPETCYVKYGAVSLRSESCHEMAIRIVLQCIQSHAGRYKRYIVPLLSISADFYIRVTVKIFTSAVKCKEVSSKSAMVYQCSGCDTLHIQPLGLIKTRKGTASSYSLSTAIVGATCSHCDSKFYIGGPIWSAPIHDSDFVRKVILAVEESNLNTKNRLLGVLHMVSEELHDIPLYYNITTLCSHLKSSTIPMMTFRSAILNGGYRISYSHANQLSFKTDAPMTFIWDVLREWIRQNCGKSKDYTNNIVATKILNKATDNKIDFSLRPDANPLSRKNKMLRFQENPAPNWGPKPKSSVKSEGMRDPNENKRKGDEQDSCDSKKIATELDYEAKQIPKT